MGGECSIIGERRGAYRVLVGNVARRKPHQRSRGTWENNIKMDLKDIV